MRAGIAGGGDQHRAPGARATDGKGHQRVVVPRQADIHHPHMLLHHPIERFGDGEGIGLALAAASLREGRGGIEIGIGQEAAPAGMRRIGGADEEGRDRRAMGGIGGHAARLEEGALMQLASGEGRQAGGEPGIDHADAQARPTAFPARPADHAPRIVRRRQRDHLGRLGLIGAVDAVDVGRHAGEVRMEQGDRLARIQAGRGPELQHRKAEGAEGPRLDQAEAQALDPGQGLGAIAQHHHLAGLEAMPPLMAGIGPAGRSAAAGGREPGPAAIHACAIAIPLIVAVAVPVPLAAPIPIALAVPISIAVSATIPIAAAVAVSAAVTLSIAISTPIAATIPVALTTPISIAVTLPVTVSAPTPVPSAAAVSVVALAAPIPAAVTLPVAVSAPIAVASATAVSVVALAAPMSTALPTPIAVSAALRSTLPALSSKCRGDETMGEVDRRERSRSEAQSQDAQ